MNDILLLTHSDISNNSLQTQLDCESQGKLICEVHLLRSYARCLPTRNSVRDLFIEDLRDLENPRLSISQKLQTINRMSRSWSFLQPTA
jgi:nuclear-control-of-ATPase protein 2